MKNRVYILALLFAAFIFGGCEKLDFPDEKKTETEKTETPSHPNNHNPDGKDDGGNDDGNDGGNDDGGNDGGNDDGGNDGGNDDDGNNGGNDDDGNNGGNDDGGNDGGNDDEGNDGGSDDDGNGGGNDDDGNVGGNDDDGTDGGNDDDGTDGGNDDGENDGGNDDDGNDGGNDDDGNNGGNDDGGNGPDHPSGGDGFYHGFETIIDYIGYYGNYSTPVPYEDMLKGGCLYVELVEKDVETATFTELNEMWMEGYVVGFVDGRSMKSTVFDAGDVATNIVIAERADVLEVGMCVPVQLPNSSKSNKETRAALNLKDHPEVLGKRVKIKGDIAKYMGVAGLKNAKQYEFVP